MSFTTMTMSKRPISASDPESRELNAALAAGWRRSDLAWERLQEEAYAAYLDGDRRRAGTLWKRAARLARWRFGSSDPRRATSLANLGFALRLANREARASKKYARARALWRDVPAWIETLRIAGRARSSLFHLRMEARHRETYHGHVRVRLNAFAEETAAALAELEQGRPATCRLHDRWRAEKPAIFDDTRKFLAAALLVASP